LQRDWVALGRARPPLLYTLHLSHISLRWPRRWFSDFGDYTHAPSVDAREWLINDAGVAAERIALIPHGVDTQRFAPPSPQRRLAARAALNLTPSDLVVLFVGRLDHPKNEGWMLDVARAARKAGMPNVKVLLAGEGPHEQELIRRIYEMGLVDTVRLLGHVDADANQRHPRADRRGRYGQKRADQSRRVCRGGGRFLAGSRRPDPHGAGRPAADRRTFHVRSTNFGYAEAVRATGVGSLFCRHQKTTLKRRLNAAV
jgi:glycosyltransferase involved in cell wall biosynthesis